MKKIRFALIAMIAGLMFFGACKQDNKKDGKSSNSIPNTSQIEQFNEQDFFANIDQSKVNEINDIIAGFASPVEMAAMLKDNHVPFSKKYLTPTSVVDNYDLNLKKALGLGIFSADLGYLNIYHKNDQIVDYLQAIFRLASDLQVAQFFDFQTLKYLVTTSDNLDSLLFLSVNSFYQIDNYFRATRRSYLSLLAVTGVWVESLYLLTAVANDNPYVDLRNQIGSQKELLNKLVSLLEVYEGHPKFDYLIKEFKKLQKAYEPVKITEKQLEGNNREVVDGRVVYTQDVESVIEIDEETMKNIIQTTEEVRNAVINIP